MASKRGRMQMWGLHYAFQYGLVPPFDSYYLVVWWGIVGLQYVVNPKVLLLQQCSTCEAMHQEGIWLIFSLPSQPVPWQTL